jgi:PAS domain S-box-containing protein
LSIFRAPCYQPFLLVLFALLLPSSTATAQHENGAFEGPDPQRLRVLLLHSYERDFAPHVAFVRQFRPELSKASDKLIDLVEISLQSARESRKAAEESVVADLQSLIAGRLDLVVPIGGPAAVFAQKYRPRLFPSTPMLLAGVDRRFVEQAALSDSDAAVTIEHDPAQIVDDILHVLPDTKTVFVVLGSSRLEQFWLDEAKRSLRRFEPRLTFVWANELSFAEMLKRCATLPPHTAVLYGMLSLDAAGVTHVSERSVTELHSVANAPVFALHRTHLGRGIVGGHLLATEELSRNTARAAIRILNGESPRSISVPTQGPGSPTFDWRELRRWNIPENRLPAGSVVLFRELTLWETHKRQIIAGATLAAVQSALVIALLTFVVRRRRAERATRTSMERLRTVSEEAPVMIWVAGTDKQVTDFNRPFLEFTGRTIEAELGSGWTEVVHPQDVGRCFETYSGAFDRRESFQMEYRLRRHDGEYRWILDTGVPRFASGAFVGYVGSAIDVTELKLAGFALSRLSRSVLQAQETERAVTARKLHEDLCQRMLALTLRLHMLSDEADGSDEMRPRLEELREQFAHLMGDLLALSDPSFARLELLGLTMCAQSLCQDAARRHGMKVEFQSSGMPSELPNDVALGVFRVLQEALDNVARHSGVKHASVWLRGSAAGIELEVVDSGRGFDRNSAIKSAGLGLIGMRERMKLVDGECVIESRPDAGTTVRARVPLRRLPAVTTAAS